MTLALCLKTLGESVHVGNAGRESALGKPPVKFGDLEMHRIIGTGQFGMVRVVRHKKSGEVYALKVGPLVLCMVLQKRTDMHRSKKLFWAAVAARRASRMPRAIFPF